MVSTHKLNRLFQRTDNARSNSAVQGGSPGVPNPPWVAPPAGQSADRLGYDGAGRMIAKRYIASYGSPSAIVGFTTGFDRASNKLYERALHAENRSHLYEPYDAVSNLPTGGYDSLDRLLQYQRGTLSSTGGDGGNGGGSIAVSGSPPAPLYINLAGTDLQRSYALDSLGNWRNTVFTPSTTGTPTAQTEIRQHNLLNEITRTSNPAATPMTINATYDLNGNLTSVGTPAFTWDALNRLATASPGGEYYYDALNRRVSKTVSDVQTDFIYSGWRCVEDRNPDGGEDETTDTPMIQYVWGRYLDELLQITTLVYITTGNGDETTTYSPGTYFPLQDMLYRTTATVTISEDGVTIVEAYDFDAYGKTLIFNAADTGPNWWGPNAQQSPNSLCQFLFTGQRFDAETGLYYYKRRMYSAWLGRFLNRDPIDYGAGDSNLYGYCFGRAVSTTDPLGLQGTAPDPLDSPPEFGPVDPQTVVPSRPGPIPEIPSPPCTCCCVDSVSFPKTAQAFPHKLPLVNGLTAATAPKGDVFGQLIKVSVGIKWRKSQSPGECELQWWEWKTTGLPGENPNTWYDEHAGPNASSPTFMGWNNRPTGPSNTVEPLLFTITDTPAMQRGPAFTGNQVIFFAIKVSSAANCPCGPGPKSKVAFAKVQLRESEGNVRTNSYTPLSTLPPTFGRNAVGAPPW